MILILRLVAWPIGPIDKRTTEFYFEIAKSVFSLIQISWLGPITLCVSGADDHTRITNNLI